ncbi:MAG: hypothetical protein ACI8T1_000311 [Verrucomicrobiales bacterium]|jgi:hypothetical protein
MMENRWSSDIGSNRIETSPTLTESDWETIARTKPGNALTVPIDPQRAQFFRLQ